MTDLRLEPYAVCLQWRFTRPLSGQEWGSLLAEYVEMLAARSANIAGSVIGHIKGLAVASDGYSRVNLVSPSLPADVEFNISGQPSALTLDLNVLIFGLPLEQVKRLTAESAERVASRWGGQVDIESASHVHAHDSP